ncbi:formylglycine-generating enzyme family protein [Winogradskyella vincentii]|uniref:Formylglycine-generating enzyme family protein n=1 Tax=Winogradskyella vincentii TaxID=2877122 RepID=A0ABS7Y0K3_9FLAO|nr:formylglycine-generating enzyme family protein [Winogradskyella vincentii]MCA0153466.1 formylglycine-generating enzyme family protein [Winogradskyella vincentii]
MTIPTNFYIYLILSSIIFGYKSYEQPLQVKHPMVKIKGGTFIMGQNSGEGDEKPEHEVQILGFYMGKYEVTVKEYRKFCNATNRDMPKQPKWGWIDNHPIINTTWYDAQDYISWLNKVSSKNYRLPTEAEFEYVIRNGGQTGTYPWSDGQPKNENLADISFGNANNSNGIWKNYDDSFAHTSPVGSFESNLLGVYDINGNIWEWCNDWHQEYTSEKRINPKGPKTGIEKVGRGGSYNADPWHSRSASRAYVKPTFEGPGFRLAKNL